MVQLQWNAFLPRGQQYQIEIATPDKMEAFGVSYPSINISLAYNTRSMITLKVCNDIVATKRFNNWKCPDPSFILGINVTKRLPVAVEGSMLMYECLADFSPTGNIMSVCKGNQWYPKIACASKFTKQL